MTKNTFGFFIFILEHSQFIGSVPVSTFKDYKSIFFPSLLVSQKQMGHLKGEMRCKGIFLL